MSVFSQAVYDRLIGDATLVSLLTTYKGAPAVFTTQPVPGDAMTPYVVSVGEISNMPFDTKNSRGRDFIRDIRAYAPARGDARPIENIAERIRYLFHRQPLLISGFGWVLSNATGPIALDETDYYGRVVSVSVKAQED